MGNLRRIDDPARMFARARSPQRMPAVAATNNHLILGFFCDAGDCMRAGFDALAYCVHDFLGPFGCIVRGFVNLIAQIVLRSCNRIEYQEESNDAEKFFHDVGLLFEQ